MSRPATILRTFAHYIRDGLIPNMFPEGAERGPLSHRRCHAVVLPRASIAICELTGDRATLRTAAAEAARHRRAPSARHALRHPRRSRRRSAAPGRGGLSAHLDGREGRRLGGHAAPRQGGGDQRALVQRAAAAGTLAVEEHGDGRARRRTRRLSRASCATSFNGDSGIENAAICSTWSTGPAATIRPAARIKSSRSRCEHPVLDASRWKRGGRRATERTAHAGRVTIACARTTPTTSRSTTATCVARRRLPSGNGVGLADRPVHRRLAQSASRTNATKRRSFSTALSRHLGEACVGSISEIFDAEAPYTPRGCVAQAWSVAEVLRCWIKTSTES